MIWNPSRVEPRYTVFRRDSLFSTDHLTLMKARAWQTLWQVQNFISPKSWVVSARKPVFLELKPRASEASSPSVPMSSSRGLRFIGRLSKTFMNFLLNLAASRDDALASSTANRGAKDGSTGKELAKSWGAFFEVSPWRNFRSNCLSQKVNCKKLICCTSLQVYWFIEFLFGHLLGWGVFMSAVKTAKKLSFVAIAMQRVST